MRIVALTVPRAAAELAADRLWAVGAQAVEELDAADGRVELRTSLGADELRARQRLGDLPEGWSVRFIEVDERPAQTWREFAAPITVNDRLVLRPAWRPETVVAGVLDVAIEPGGSFGLGDHPTTRLSAALADETVVPGDRVLDVGCGSGVLAIIAALRGAAHVVAIDIAEPAREATADNARRNGVASSIDASTAAIESIDGTFDVVFANILAPTLIAIAPELIRVTARAGRLIISGVLTGEYDHVAIALDPMQVVAARDADGWSAVVLAHPSEGSQLTERARTPMGAIRR